MPASLFDAEFLARLGTIVVIDLLLAGDNAVVIALAVRSLPKRQQFVGRVFGTVAAVVLRVALIAIATVLLKIPFMVMSLDNVLGVAAAAHGDLRLVVFGIALSVPIVVWGSRYSAS